MALRAGQSSYGLKDQTMALWTYVLDNRLMALRIVKSLIIIRLDYYLTSLLTKIATVTRTSQATAPQSVGLPYKSVRRLICAYLQGPQFLSLEPKPRLI